MKDFVFITGNQHKADYLAKWLGAPVAHHKFDLDELQSLDLRRVAEHKVRQAYALLQQPALVEDVALTFTAMGRLPGTLVKWFVEEIGNEGLCKVADTLAHREAVASICYAYYDGKQVRFFESHLPGEVALRPRGEHGFGWNAAFIPKGSTKTYAEMTEDEVRPFSMRARAIDKLRTFLQA
ncbi:MAG TPA: non-canonical purine NTP pyrophosphatase [Candidatus Saccharimonadales bacterium]|nr:non-canonical purine NTP pyrophosphatase [Candidatus Saccharimonadales bacterium]